MTSPQLCAGQEFSSFIANNQQTWPVSSGGLEKPRPLKLSDDQHFFLQPACAPAPREALGEWSCVSESRESETVRKSVKGALSCVLL